MIFIRYPALSALQMRSFQHKITGSIFGGSRCCSKNMEKYLEMNEEVTKSSCEQPKDDDTGQAEGANTVDSGTTVRKVREDPILFNFKLTIVRTVTLGTYTEKTARAYLDKVAAQKHHLPDGRVVQFSVKTYERWVRLFRESNEDCSVLETHSRIDKGVSRKLTPVVMERIKEFITLEPKSKEKSSAYAILRRLVHENLLENEDAVSEETIRRFIRDNNLREEAVIQDARIRHMFIMANVGDMWQADTCYYFKLYVKELEKWVYIQGIMDDHSRYIVSARCYLEDTASNFRKTLFYAIEHHHIPHMIIVDNGGPYVDKDLIDLCKRLGIALVHTRANDGAGKGALERWWRSIQGATMLDLIIDRPNSVEEVQKIVDDWVNDYHNKKNTGIKGKPLERYLDSIARHPVRKPESIQWLKGQFLASRERSVRCTCVSVDAIKFRVPDELARKKKLTVRYDPDDVRGTIYAVVDDKRYPLKEDDLEANSREKRNTGGRKAQLREKAEAKEAAKRAAAESTMESIPEITLPDDGKSIEVRRAEDRYARRTAGTSLQNASGSENSDSDAKPSLIGELDFSTF